MRILLGAMAICSIIPFAANAQLSPRRPIVCMEFTFERAAETEQTEAGMIVFKNLDDTNQRFKFLVEPLDEAQRHGADVLEGKKPGTARFCMRVKQQ
jgi:hypothetical protein